MRIIFLLVLGVFSIVLEAKDNGTTQSPLCDDMSRFSCAPGSYDDGTGIVKSEKIQRKKIDEVIAKQKKAIEEKVVEALQNPKNKRFRDLSKAVNGLMYASQCNPEDDDKDKEDKIKQCFDNTAEGVTNAVERLVFGDLRPELQIPRLQNAEELEYLEANTVFKELVNDFKENIAKEFDFKEKRKVIKDTIFGDVQKLLVEEINKLPIDKDQKKLMTDKIAGIEFDESDCKVDSKKKSNLTELVHPNAYYDEKDNTFMVCSGFLYRSNSIFSLVHAIAHELGHSVDPCSIAKGPRDLAFQYPDRRSIEAMQEAYPIPGLIACLRSEKSLGAKQLNKVKNPTSAEGQDSPQEEATNGEEQTFCDGDQIVEAVADWLSSRVISKYVHAKYELTPQQYVVGYSNVIRLGCENFQKPIETEISNKKSGKTKETSEHPTMYKRMNAGLLTNPEVRKDMGCNELHKKYINCEPMVEVDSSTKVKAKRMREDGINVEKPTSPKGATE